MYYVASCEIVVGKVLYIFMQISTTKFMIGEAYTCNKPPFSLSFGYLPKAGVLPKQMLTSVY